MLNSGAYVLKEDVKNPRPWKGRSDWLSQPVWKKGTRFIIFSCGPEDGSRPVATYLRCVDRGGDSVKLAVAGEAYDEVEDPRWCAVVHRVLPRLEPVDDPELALDVAGREQGYEALFNGYALAGLLRSGKLTIAEVVAAYKAEDAFQDKRIALERAEEAKAEAEAEAAKPPPPPKAEAPKAETPKPAKLAVAK